MASKARPPILAAPLEIRFEIYRHAWTISDSDARELFEKIVRLSRYDFNYFPEFFYSRLQVEQLHTLVSICQQIRDEVLSEYFHQTQVGFSNRRNPSSSSLGRRASTHIAKDIQSSLLFASYTQHVSIRWIVYFDRTSSSLMTSTLDWLLQLKQLKTLELIIRWSGRQGRLKSTPSGMFDSSPFQRFTTLRNLEKLVVKLVGSSGEETPEAQRIQDILSKSVREDLRQPEQQPTYVFENLIGSHIHYTAWRLPYRI